MIDINKYIESGIIESHCLGIATVEESKELLELCEKHPEIKEELIQTQLALESYARSFEKVLPPSSRKSIKSNILEAIKLEGVTLLDDGTLSEFIDISANPNLDRVEAIIRRLQPPENFESVHVKTIYADGVRELNLVWVKDLVPMEEHVHLDESFLVLEGSADCNIDGVITKMERGDYMRIPPESKHEVIITSTSPAKAIQCRITIAS